MLPFHSSQFIIDDLRDLIQFKTRCESVKQCDHLRGLHVPHITVCIAEMSLGLIEQCKKCNEDIRLLSEDVDVMERRFHNHGVHRGVKYQCNHYCQDILCDDCFGKVLHEYNGMIQALGVHQHSNLGDHLSV